MKSSTYAVIDAHILRCKLHHLNNLTYSVGLKTNKDQQTATSFKPSHDLFIQMDNHLTLQVDKHSYQHFPKLTLIVSTKGPNQEIKTVGTTFANFRKEGIHTYQISECSCKDKAFEVEISFTTKILEAKNSNNKAHKRQTQKTSHAPYYSQQVTPRQSRQFKRDIISKIPKQFQKIESPKKQAKLTHVKSQQITKKVSPDKVHQKISKKAVEDVKGQIAALNQTISVYKVEIEELRQFRKRCEIEKQSSEMWHQLFKLQEQKNGVAMSHIVTLEEIILCFMPKSKSIKNVSAATSFKIIEEEDQILALNQELQSQLQKERQTTKLLYKTINKLEQQISELTTKLKINQQTANKLKQQSVLSSLKVKSCVDSFIQSPNQIMITSRCKEKDVQNKEKQQLYRKQIDILQQKYHLLREEVENLQIQRKNLKQTVRTKVDNKKSSVSNIPRKPPVRQANQQKIQQTKSKDKSPKVPPAKGQKRTNISSQSTSDNRKVKESISSNVSTANNITKPSVELETKTQGAQSFETSEIGVTEMKSETPLKMVNKAQYFMTQLKVQQQQFQS